MRNRNRSLADINERRFDVIVIGAGINGCGIARDAAMRGLNVLLLDKGDIAAGTTSSSSRLIHGGLRYLEHAEIALVRESLREREVLLHTAPHLVRPLPLLIPIYRGNRRGPLTIRIGMIAYDVLSFDKSVDHHHMLSRDEALWRAPGLNPRGLRGAALYYDAQVEFAERLAVENALGARDHGATVLTYARVDRLLTDGNRITGVALTDVLGHEAAVAHAAVVVNVAGPWVDEVLAELGQEVPRLMGGTKGTHIVVPPFPGAPNEALYVEASRDGRPYFVIPWTGRYLIGTTDIRYAGALDSVEPSAEEIDYLLGETNRVIPRAGLTRESVIASYAGVRPLPYHPEGAAGGITRRHIVRDHAPAFEGLISIIGGKLTTYRNLAAETVDAIYRKLGRKAPPCRTATVPLPGAQGDFGVFRERFLARSDLSARSASHLLRVYGTRAADVLALANGERDLLQLFDERTGAIGAEIVMAFRQEMAQTLSDALLRRTMVGLGAPIDSTSDEAAAAIAQHYLDWSPERAARELAAYREDIARFHPLAQAASGQQGTGADALPAMS